MSFRTALMASAMLAGVASFAGCQRQSPQVAALPLDTGAAAPLGEAPPPSGLPPAPPARIATLTDYRDAYAYPDRAWGLSWAFGDSPPDYAFYDDGVTPWVWIADDDSECLAEPVPGGERYYYFAPGAYTPFYVQDTSYGYGFDDGQLVAIYASGGRQIAPAADPMAAATAGQYLARGRLLRQAEASQPHRPVAAANWSARRGLIAAARTTFEHDASRDPAWLAYHRQHQPQDQDRFAAEAARRESWAAQTDTRLGDASHARREQRLARSIAAGVGPGRPSAPAPAAQPPALALNRYAAAAPRPGAPASDGASAVRREPASAAARAAEAVGQPAVQRQARSEFHAPFERQPRAARRPAERPQAAAQAAGEHASDVAARARESAAITERRAASPAAAAPRAFHALPAAAPPAQAQAAHGAPPPAARPAPQAAPQAHPPPQAHPAPHGNDRADKRH